MAPTTKTLERLKVAALALIDKETVDAQESYPIGAHVRVVRCDVETYVGRTGRVTGYSLGDDGDWALVRVDFDEPIQYASGHTNTGDAFYADGDGSDNDEIVVIP